MLSRPIKLRLSPEQLFIYESEAAYLNKSLNSYLRDRLEKADDVLIELQQLRHLLEHLPASSPASSVEANAVQRDQGTLLEILLLLRLLAGPEKMLMVQKELQRLKIPFWTDHSPEGSNAS